MKTESKEEVLSEEEEQPEDIELGPALLGLQRVGTAAPAKPKTTPTQPAQVLNARGMPARIRKKNKMFYDDELVNTPHHRVPSAKKTKTAATSPVKQESGAAAAGGGGGGSGTVRKYKKKPKPPPTPFQLRDRGRLEKPKRRRPSPPPTVSPDRKIGQQIGLRLRNLLKLPKAHKWVCFEWFYSNIDRCLFNGDNDFQICLKESFPDLKTRLLTRVEWTKIRRMMGRPRRCSQAFFNQERLDLEKKRNKIRAMQQRKVTDFSTFQDLPTEIPMQLCIGTKVTARLRKPQDGLFTGSVDAVDTSNNTYRVTFDRAGLGTHSVPDYEVLSNDMPEMLSLANAQRRHAASLYYGKSPAGYNAYSSIKMRKDRDPMMANFTPQRVGTLGAATATVTTAASPAPVRKGFPGPLLERMALVRKVLNAKRLKINLMKTMNEEAERLTSFDAEIPEDFERRYAGIVIDLEKLNKDLQVYLDEMQHHCQDIAYDSRTVAMLTPSHLREKCQEQAVEMLERLNPQPEDGGVKIASDSIMDLITDLTAMMLQVKCLADTDQNVFEVQVLEGTMESIKRKLSPANQKVFQSSIECHMKHIGMSLTPAIFGKKYSG